MSAFYEEGRYRAEIINQALGKNKNTGTPQFVLKVQILAAADGDGERVVRQQYERTIYLYLSENAAPYTIEKLKGMGFDKASFCQLDLEHPQAHDFRGLHVELMCRHEKDNTGESREKWDVAFIGSGAIDNTPLDAAEARKLDAMFGKSFAGAKPLPTAKQKPAAVAVKEIADVITDDDIPF